MVDIVQEKPFDEWFDSLTKEEQEEYVADMEADSYTNEPAVIMDYDGHCSLA